MHEETEMTKRTNRQYTLAARPQGAAKLSDFKLVVAEELADHFAPVARRSLDIHSVFQSLLAPAGYTRSGALDDLKEVAPKGRRTRRRAA